MSLGPKEYAKSLVSKSLTDTFEYLNDIITSSSDLHNDLITQKTKFLFGQKEFHKGTISFEDYTVLYNRTSAGLLSLIDDFFSGNRPQGKDFREAMDSNSLERKKRLVSSKIVKIDDKRENVRNRSFFSFMVYNGPFLLFWVLSSIFFSYLMANPRFFTSTADQVFVNVFTVVSFLMAFYFLYQVIISVRVFLDNDKTLPRKKEVLEVAIKGDYDTVLEGVFHSLVEFGATITDYDFEKGEIAADSKNSRIYERLGSAPSILWGERVIVNIEGGGNVIDIKISSTAKTTNPIAHEGDIFGLHRRINNKNLIGIKKLLIDSLIS